MKKIAVILCAVLVLSGFAGYADEADFSYSKSEKTERLKEYGIINCYEDGNFYPEKNITRAEFCKMIAIMLGMKGEETSRFFDDVPQDHWANKYITFCHSRGLVNGTQYKENLYFVDVDENGNEVGGSEAIFREEIIEYYGIEPDIPVNLFSPDDHITYRDALKILVCALGYEEKALREGGYPHGYTDVAESIGLVDADYYTDTDLLTRENAAVIVFNALFIPLFEKVEYDNRVEYYVADGNNGKELKNIYKEYFE